MTPCPLPEDAQLTLAFQAHLVRSQRYHRLSGNPRVWADCWGMRAIFFFRAQTPDFMSNRTPFSGVTGINFKWIHAL